MKVIVLDLEMNQPSEKIIQIGAWHISVNVEGFKFVEDFDCFVNPEELLSEEIIKLTGIKQFQVDGAEKTLKAAQDFIAWVKYVNPHMCVSWGADWYWFMQQTGYRPGRVLDLKLMHNLLQAQSSGKKRSKGLLGALNSYGIKFHGQQHNARLDAYNTGLLMQAMIKRHSDMGKIMELIND